MDKESVKQLMLKYFNYGIDGVTCLVIPTELMEYESEFLACFRLGAKLKDSL